MDKNLQKKKDLVEAELKQMLNPEEGNDIKDKKEEEIQEKDDQNQKKTIPDFVIFFEIFDMVSKKALITYENYSQTTYSKGQIQREYKENKELVLKSNFEKNSVQDLPTVLENHAWNLLINKHNQLIFLFYPSKTKAVEIRSFFEKVGDISTKLKNKCKADADFKKNIKMFLDKYFLDLASTDTTGRKVYRIQQKIDQAQDKIEHTLIDVNKNFINIEYVNKDGEEAHKIAKEMDEGAKALADAMAGGDRMMTIIMIVVVGLLAVAVFSNLYATIKNPGGAPPPRKMQILNVDNPTAFVDNDQELINKYGHQHLKISKKNRGNFANPIITLKNNYKQIFKLNFCFSIQQCKIFLIQKFCKNKQILRIQILILLKHLKFKENNNYQKIIRKVYLTLDI